MPPEEREAFWEKLYGAPGFGIWNGQLSRHPDQQGRPTPPISAYIAKKIRQRVKDPKVADKLIPKESRLRHVPQATVAVAAGLFFFLRRWRLKEKKAAATAALQNRFGVRRLPPLCFLSCAPASRKRKESGGDRRTPKRFWSAAVAAALVFFFCAARRLQRKESGGDRRTPRNTPWARRHRPSRSRHWQPARAVLHRFAVPSLRPPGWPWRLRRFSLGRSAARPTGSVGCAVRS